MTIDAPSTLVIAVANAVAATVLTIAVTLAALSQPDVTGILALRTLAVTLVLAVVVPALVRRRIRTVAAEAILPTALLGAILGYAINPTSWDGGAYLGQLFLQPGVVTTLVDLVVWLLVAVLAITWWSRRDPAGSVAA